MSIREMSLEKLERFSKEVGSRGKRARYWLAKRLAKGETLAPKTEKSKPKRKPRAKKQEASKDDQGNQTTE